MSPAPVTTLAGTWRIDDPHRLAALGPEVAAAGALRVVGDAELDRQDGVVVAASGRPREGLATRAATLYRDRGADALADLVGHWTLALLDEQAGTLILARDPLGGRSLHYARVGGALVFGAEARDVLALLERTPGPDRAAVCTWLASGTLPAEGGLHAGILRLGPGQVLVATAAGLRTRTVWEPSFHGAADGDFEETAAGVRAAVDGAVLRALGGTRAAGVLLSGGLDSSVVAASARVVAPDVALRAYSATFPDHPEADESRPIALMTERYALPGTQATVRGGRPLREGLRYLDAWGLPSTSPNTFLWLPLLEAAAQAGHEVVLDGEGGDETFDSRPFYLLADLAARGRLGRAWALTLRYPGADQGTNRRVRLRVLAHFLRRGLRPHRLHVTAGRRAAARQGAGALLAPADARDAVDRLDEWAWRGTGDPRWWSARSQAVVRMPHLLDAAGSLRRTAALAGVRDRHPLLLDRELIEHALRVPPELGFDAHAPRPVIRAAERDRLPEEIRERTTKSHFSLVLARGLWEGDRGFLRELLGRDARVREFVAPGWLDHTTDALNGDSVDLPADLAVSHLWRAGAMECWLRQLEDPGFARNALDRASAGSPIVLNRTR